MTGPLDVAFEMYESRVYAERDAHAAWMVAKESLDAARDDLRELCEGAAR